MREPAPRIYIKIRLTVNSRILQRSHIEINKGFENILDEIFFLLYFIFSSLNNFS